MTLPFIVGADARERKVEATVSDVRRVLGEMRALSGPEGSLRLLWCPNVRADVFGLTSLRGGQLKVEDGLVRPGTTEEMVFEKVALDAEAVVQKGCFSRMGDPPEWAPLDDEGDLKFIDAVIAQRAQ